MAYTEAGKRATIKYVKANYDRMELRVMKGEKTLLQAEAEEHGQSVTQYIIQAVNERAGRQLLTPSEK